jgi:DNA-binding response OmpR family regulator
VARILIAEDDPLVAAFIDKGLKAHGYTPHVVDDGAKAEQLALADEFDLMILDMGLPARSGFQVLQALRGRGSPLAVIVLTGRRERDVVACLEAGADDYMTKPFHFDELLARVRVRLRAPATRPVDELRTRDIVLDLRARQVRAGDTSVELTGREFALLELFLRHAGQILTREQILVRVWGYSTDPSSNVVNVYINQLRNKLGQELIETVRGLGYRIPAG